MNSELELKYYDVIMNEYIEKFNFQKIEQENESLKRENEELKKKNYELNKFIETIMSNFNLHIKNDTTFNV